MATKVVISPIDHFTGARFSRRTWRAEIANRETGETITPCAHDHGHRTIENAKTCGLRLWRKSQQ